MYMCMIVMYDMYVCIGNPGRDIPRTTHGSCALSPQPRLCNQGSCTKLCVCMYVCMYEGVMHAKKSLSFVIIIHPPIIKLGIRSKMSLLLQRD